MCEVMEKYMKESREEGQKSTTEILRLYTRGENSGQISEKLHLDLQIVNAVIADFER